MSHNRQMAYWKLYSYYLIKYFSILLQCLAIAIMFFLRFYSVKSLIICLFIIKKLFQPLLLKWSLWNMGFQHRTIRASTRKQAIFKKKCETFIINILVHLEAHFLRRPIHFSNFYCKILFTYYYFITIQFKIRAPKSLNIIVKTWRGISRCVVKRSAMQH